MHASFWHQRWQEQRIGFHKDKINSYLSKHWPKLNIPEKSRILVPLCGKSLDLCYFPQHGLKVLGNELSTMAVQDFYTEQQLNASKTVICDENSATGQHQMTLWQSDNIDIICADFFDLKKQQLSDIKAVYDRAALVALPADMRKKYVRKMLEILPKNISMLLLTLDYNQNEKQGPPFSVTQDEVFELYEPYFTIELLEVSEIEPQQRSPRSQNMSYFNERVFFLQSK